MSGSSFSAFQLFILALSLSYHSVFPLIKSYFLYIFNCFTCYFYTTGFVQLAVFRCHKNTKVHGNPRSTMSIVTPEVTIYSQCFNNLFSPRDLCPILERQICGGPSLHKFPVSFQCRLECCSHSTSNILSILKEKGTGMN